MAGLGRRTHYRKHLTDSIIYDLPEPGDNEKIAKVVATRGSNQFDIILPLEDGRINGTVNQRESHLAILPTKFNKLVWVKRNDFVIVESAKDNDNNNHHDNHDKDGETQKKEGGGDTDKVETVAVETGSIRYIISHILYKDQVKHLQTKGIWPTKDFEFVTEKLGLRNNNPDDDEEETSNIDDDDGEEEPNDDDDDGIVYDMGYEDDDFLVNTNRIAALKVDDSSDSDDSSEE